jgi:hypothetical protein
MSLIGRGTLVQAGYTLLGTADVDNAAGATDTFLVPQFTGTGTPQVVVNTPAVGQVGNVAIEGADATDLYSAGEGLTSTVVTNLVSLTLATALNVTGFATSLFSIRSGLLGVVNLYHLVCIGNGASLSVYIRKEI